MTITLSRCLSVSLAMLALTMTACGGPRHVSEEWQPGIPKRQGITVSGRQQGQWSYFDPQGRLEAAGDWSDDLQSGLWTYYFPGGQVRRQGAYEAGMRSGPWLQFHENGQQAAVGGYVRDRQTGWWHYHWPDGSSFARGWFSAGVRAGIWERHGQDGAPLASGPWYLGLKVGTHATWDKGIVTLTDCGAPSGMTASTRMVGDVAVWTLLQDGQERFAYAHRQGHPLAMRAQLDGHTTVASWEATGRACITGDRDARGRVGTWNLVNDTGMLVANASFMYDRVTLPASGSSVNDVDLLAEEHLRQAAAPVEEASATLAARERQWFDAHEDPPPTAPVVVEGATSMTLTAGPTTTVPAPAQPAQLDLTLPAPGPVSLSPVDLLPRWWTTAQEAKAGSLVAHYTATERDSSGYDQPAAVAPAAGNAPELVGHPLPQQRFLASDGAVYDLADHRGRPVVVVVMRGFSGQVCLYCAAQTAALSDNVGRFTQAHADVLVVYPGPAESVPAFVQAVQSLRRDPPPMPLALDVSLALVRGLGIEGNLAKPTALVLDGQGIVRYAYTGSSIADRPSVDDLITAVSRIAP
jgi:peroxiredoxin